MDPYPESAKVIDEAVENVRVSNQSHHLRDGSSEKAYLEME
jgi:hypothetical protein